MRFNKCILLVIYAIIAIVVFTPLYAENSNYTGNIINITDDNYDDYFDVYSGEMNPESNINDGDRIHIGNVTDKTFVINKQLEITTMHNGDIIKNGYVKLVKGSDGSWINYY